MLELAFPRLPAARRVMATVVGGRVVMRGEKLRAGAIAGRGPGAPPWRRDDLPAAIARPRSTAF
jgi:hypothetical protein